MTAQYRAIPPHPLSLFVAIFGNPSPFDVIFEWHLIHPKLIEIPYSCFNKYHWVGVSEFLWLGVSDIVKKGSSNNDVLQVPQPLKLRSTPTHCALWLWASEFQSDYHLLSLTHTYIHTHTHTHTYTHTHTHTCRPRQFFQISSKGFWSHCKFC